VTAVHSSGQWQTLSFSAAMPADLQTIGVSFLNDAYGGASTLDRNLYVDHIIVNGVTFNPQQGAFLDLWGDAPAVGSSALYNAGTLGWNAAALLVDPTAHPIIAANQMTQTDAAHAVTVNLLANAFDPNPSATLAVSSVNLTGTQGLVVLNSDGTASYAPGGAFANLTTGQTMTDVFHYTISDGHGSVSTAADTVTVTGVASGTASVSGFSVLSSAAVGGSNAGLVAAAPLLASPTNLASPQNLLIDNAAPSQVGGASIADHNILTRLQNESGFDLHPHIADPLLADGAHDNFTLAANFSAYALGFQDLPVAQTSLPGYHAISSFDLFGH